MNFCASLAITYYKTPENLGGGNGRWYKNQLMRYISFPTTPNGKRLVTENGQIKIKVKNQGQKLIVIGFGNEIALDEEKGVKARLVLRGPDAEPRLVFIN